MSRHFWALVYLRYAIRY